MATKRKKPSPVLDTPEENLHIIGPVIWTLFVYAASGVLDALDIDPRHVALIGALAVITAPIVAIFRRFTFLVMASLVAFLTWTSATTPWARYPALVAVAACILFGTSYHALRKREAAREKDGAAEAQVAAEKGRYVELMDNLGAKGLRERGRVPFPAGKTITLRLPADGSTTFKKLKALEDAMETATDSVPGAFLFERGDTQGTVKLHVLDRDILAEKIPLEFDRGPKSVLDPMPLGKFQTGEVCEVTFREVAALMVGLKGKGKSALINTHLSYLTGCTDAVVWMLDGKNGETVWPWIEPFLEATTGRPCIDWVAIGQEEEDAMLLGVNAAIKYRSFGGRKRITPSAQTPSIILIVEEASQITGVGKYGNANRAALAQTAVTQGRSSCVDSLFATQRATVTMIGNGDMKSNLDLIYGLGVTRPEDARMIFPDGGMAETLYKLGDAERYRGVFLMQSPESTRVMPAKGYWVEPETIPGIAQTNSQWSGTLDAGTADAVHTELVSQGVPGGYHGRWDRLTGTTPVSAELTSAPAARPTEIAEASHGAKLVQDAMRKSRETREAERELAAFDAIVSGESWGDEEKAAPALPDTVPAILRLMLASFVARSADALPTQVLLDDLPGGMTPHALGRLMALCSVSPSQNVTWEGKRVRGYDRDAIETSIKRGSWTKGATDWTP